MSGIPPAGTSRTSLSIAATAVVGPSYVPPFKTSQYGNQATARTTSTYRNPNPTTPAFLDDYQWINSYLTIHKMSTPSYRYAYLMWLVIALFVGICAALHLSGGRGGTFGARWSKWALRRRTWRKKSTLAAIQKSKQPHRQPYSLPSNAQILSLIGLFVIPAILCCIGPDYIGPYTNTWDFTHNLTRRAFIEEYSPLHWMKARQMPIASTVTTRAPEFTIPKEWWTAGGRTGIIAFALFPLVVLFSLKAPPFAILALPFTIQIHFDKLARLHRWLGRMIWLVTAVHVVTWSVQLGNDHRHGSRKGIAWDFVWVYPKFIYGIIGFVAMTLMTILSAGPIRTRYYELFYISHVILVPITLVFSALHFPVIWGWCWAPLALWVAERIFRGFRFVLVNGYLGRRSALNNFQYPEDDEAEKAYGGAGLASPTTPLHKRQNMFSNGNNAPKSESWEMDVRSPRSADSSVSRKDRESQYLGADEFMSLTSATLSAANLGEYNGVGNGGTRERVTSGDSSDSFTESIVSYYENSMADDLSAPTSSSTPHAKNRPRPHSRSGSASASQSWNRTRWSSFTKQPLLTDPSTHHPLKDSDGDDLGLITPTTLVTDTDHTVYPPVARRQPGIKTSASSYSVVSNGNKTAGLESSSMALLGGPRSASALQFNSAGTSVVHRHLPSRLPPLGFARVQLLPGRTVRLTIVTPRRFAWAPGQHVLLNMPEISLWTSHPFTVASVSDQAIAGPEGREITLIVRAKKGFTKRLWDEVKKRGIIKREAQAIEDEGEKSIRKSNSGSEGRAGVLFKANVDGPFGSSVRARWGQHSTVLIVCGGSGVSFGTSIMEFVCLCMTGRDGRSLGGRYGGGFGKDGFVTRRIRFVWLIREYSHLHWCATIIRRCLDLIPNPNQLQVDVFVTNFVSKSTTDHDLYMGGPSDGLYGDESTGKDGLQPPAPRFAREGKTSRRGSVSSTHSEESNLSSGSIADLDYSDGGRGNGTKGSKRSGQEPSTSHLDDGDEHVLDLTNFDGEDDARTPGEMQLSLKLKKEGKLRRAKSRKVATAKAAKEELVLKAAGHGAEMGERIHQPTARLIVKGGGGLLDSPVGRDVTPPPRWGTTTPKVSDDLHHPPSPVHHVRLGGDNRFSVADSLAASTTGSAFGGSESMKGLMMHHMATAGSSIGHGSSMDDHTPEEIVFDIDDDEVEDLNVISEMARPGKPRLDKILADEVERAKGAVAVACCGPTSLNALIRKLVAANIDPDKIARGDRRGQITLISEDFEW